jgi:hypothetical protein
VRRRRHLDAARRLTAPRPLRPAPATGGGLRLHRPARLQAAAVLAWLLGGCLGPVEPTHTTWEASLVAAQGFAPLGGTVGALAEPSRRRTEVSIEVMAAPPSSTLPWRIRAGSCGSSGAVVGAPVSYPDLETDETGRDEQRARLSQALDADGVYVVEVAAPGGAGIIACGELRRQ